MKSDRLLVLDDEPDICGFIKEVAEENGFGVATANDFQQFTAAYRLRFSVLAIAVAVVVWSIALAGRAGADGDPVVLTTQEWAPYQLQSGNEQTGVAVDVVRCAFEQLKRPLRIVFYPWQRAQEEAEAGRAAGFFAASRSQARDRFAVMSAPIAPQQWTWYFRPDASIRPTDRAFRGQARVTATSGSNMAAWLRQREYRVQPEPRSADQLIWMLERGRVDAVLSNSLVFRSSLARTKTSPDRFLSETERDKPLGVYFVRGFLERNPDLLESFNRQLPACTASLP